MKYCFVLSFLLEVVLVLLFLVHNSISEDTTPSLLIIIRSQANAYHNHVANENKANLDAQIQDFKLNAEVVLMHREWPIESAWAILPLMPDIARKYSEKYEWIMLIEDSTKVDIKRLMQNVLLKYNSKKTIYLGRCLFDKEITIIHHFAFHDGKVKSFNFPDFHAGWILSSSLVQKIGDEWDSDQMKDFQIDVQHEVAMQLNDKHNVKMTCVEEICGSQDGPECVTWIDYHIPDCGSNIGLDDILIGVKTTLMFHDTRVKVVKYTWGQYPKNIVYYSNATDPSIPTIDCGVPNTVRGHCGKMEAIIKDAYSNPKWKDLPWLVIADDDTILGLSQLVSLLNCYDPKIPIVLGERYGYGLNSGQGYSYITGGGSMVMSRGAIDAWIKKGCKCPSIDTPDDMLLGQCFSYSVGIPVTHSPRFHQARPEDYSDGYLGNLQPVSFHKHWEVDPIKVYQTYFSVHDQAAFQTPPPFDTTPAPEPIPVPIPPTPTEVPIKDEL